MYLTDPQKDDVQQSFFLAETLKVGRHVGSCRSGYIYSRPTKGKQAGFSFFGYILEIALLCTATYYKTDLFLSHFIEYVLFRHQNLIVSDLKPIKQAKTALFDGCRKIDSENLFN